MAASQRRLYKIFPVIQYSVLKLQRSTDGRIPSLLAKQEEQAILKGSFPALILRKGTNIHTNHRTHMFLRAKTVHHLYPPPLQETY